MTKADTRTKNGRLAFGAVAAGVLIGAAFFINDGFSHREIAMDPIAEREIRQARQLGRSGNWEEAARILSRTSSGSSPRAKLEYALLYTRGWGVKRDLERARILLLQAVQQDFPGRGRVAFELGKLYRKSRGKDCARIAFEWYTKAIKWDYYKAHAELGKSHARGLGVPVDIERALYHYKLAANYGSPAAVIPLINIIARGSDLRDPDPVRARSLLAEFHPMLEAEAKKGSGVSARTLGRMYSKGPVLKRNIARAMHWYSVAASLGDAAAMHDLALLSLDQGAEFQDSGKILELLNESAERGYGGAMTALGRLHLKRKLKLEPEGAPDWFRKGVTVGHAGSMEELAKLYLSGKLVEKNREEALRLAKQGARQNHRGSRALLKKIEARIAKNDKKNAKQKTKNQG